MIQRIQTIWLLLASVCGFATLKLPFYIGSLGNTPATPFTAMSNLLLLVLTIGAAILALVTIFLYSNRPLQMKLGIAGLAVAILNVLLYFIETGKFDTGALALYAVLAFAVPVCFFLAVRGIYKDEQLVKRADRLR